MSTAAAKLPAVRLPAVFPGPDGESDRPDSVMVELPSSSKFSISWPADSTPAAPAPLPPLSDRPTSLSSSDADSGLSESDSGPVSGRVNSESRRRATMSGRRPRGEDIDESELTPTGRLNVERNPMENIPPPLPRLSRAFSVPLPSQVRYLKNPRRMPSDSLVEPFTPPIQPSQETAHLHELSLELADSVQMVIQTLLQLSPPQVFDPAKEQFSACALPIPTPSISAMFTTMKNLNYMSANMAAFSIPCASQTRSSEHASDAAPPSIAPQLPAPVVRDFDIGETLQSVGDSLSGLAAEAGVDLVLFHGDVGMKHIAVKGDESGISYTLCHIVRQVLSIAHREDSVQIGLFLVAPVHTSPEDAYTLSEEDAETLPDATDSSDLSSSPDPTSPLRCTFQISHVFAPSETPPSDWDPPPPSRTRLEPSVNSYILRRLLHHIGAVFTPEPTPTSFSCKLSMTLERGSPAVVNPAIILSDDDPILQTFPDLRISGEPTLEDLAQFVDTLKGKKVSLYASSKGLFAQHLTSYLTAWGLDVSHISSDSDIEGSPAPTDSGLPTFQPADYPPPVNESIGSSTVLETLQEQDSSPVLNGSTPALPQAASFVLIDDDVSVLRERLRKIRSEQQYPLHIGSRKRPALSAHHRPRSSPQVARTIGISPSMQAQTSPKSPGVIIHFTSLSNFKLVKGILQSVLAHNTSPSARWPEVIVIPKPAGPRRVLTALHTAVTKPMVDSFFSPIATSPMSPGLYPPPSYVQQGSSPRSPVARPGGSPRGNSNSALKSPKDHPMDGSGLAPPSPLGLSEGMDYFSEAAVKLGSSPSSGLVIQSPDGQPAGIFFHPRARVSRGVTIGGIPMERDRGQFFSLPTRERPSSRRASGASDPTRVRITPTFLRGPPSNGATPSVSPRRSSNVVAPPDLSSAAASGASDTEKKADGGLSAEPRGQFQHRQSILLTEPPELEPIDPAAAVRPAAARKGTVEAMRKASTPPASPRSATGGPSSSMRKGSSRRSPMETTPPTVLGKKPKGAEPSIVPPISVLIVDDNPINQTILSTFMKKKKLKYDVAKNGEEAVNKWKTGRFHLILMDIQMPVMDGISATKEIRKLEKANASQGYPSTPSSEGQRTPSEAASTESRASSSPYRSSVIIVALTASSLQSDRVAALAAGCNDFLTKPVSLVWLNSKIIEWGSIKALQMWADIRPEVVKTIITDQTAQAQNIARRLHVPEGRASPSVSPSRAPSQPITPVQAGAANTPSLLALASTSAQTGRLTTSAISDPPEDLIRSDENPFTHGPSSYSAAESATNTPKGPDVTVTSPSPPVNAPAPGGLSTSLGSSRAQDNAGSPEIQGTSPDRADDLATDSESAFRDGHTVDDPPSTNGDPRPEIQQ